MSESRIWSDAVDELLDTVEQKDKRIAELKAQVFDDQKEFMCYASNEKRLKAKLDAVEKKADAILNRREWVVDEDELAEQIIEIIREQKDE